MLLGLMSVSNTAVEKRDVRREMWSQGAAKAACWWLRSRCTVLRHH